MAEFVTTGSGVPTNAFFEPTHRAGAHLLWEADATYSRTVITIDNSEGLTPMPGKTVSQKAL